MTLWEQGGDVGEVIPEVAKFIAETRATLPKRKICTIKFIVSGRIQTKCGKVNHPRELSTIWFKDMTCKECLAGIRNHNKPGI